MHRGRTKTDLAFHKTNICALESADSISSCFLHSPIFKARPGNVSKALSGLASSVTSAAGSAPETFEGTTFSHFGISSSAFASGKRKGHAIPPPQTSVWKVDRRGESSSWSSQVRRTRTRSGREGTRGTERSPRRRVGRTNLTVGRGEPARAGCFAIDSQGLGLKSQWKTRAHFGGHLSLLRRL